MRGLIEPTDHTYQHQVFEKPYFGAHGAGEIPVLIPNTEVKPSSGDYTATSGKLARCRIIKRPSEKDGLFLFIIKYNSSLQSDLFI